MHYYQFRHLLFIAFLVLLTRCDKSKTLQETNVAVAGEKSLSKDAIPSEIKEYLTTNFSGWSIPDTSDYIKSWWSFYDRDQIPYFVATDLNDDQKTDYGFILKNEDTIQLVFLVSSANTYKHWTDQTFNSYNAKAKDIEFGLHNEPPGRTDWIINGEESSLILASNGIALMTFEIKLRIYYWMDGELNVYEINPTVH